MSTDVQRLSSLYDATRSKLLENETYSQVSDNLDTKLRRLGGGSFIYSLRILKNEIGGNAS